MPSDTKSNQALADPLWKKETRKAYTNAVKRGVRQARAIKFGEQPITKREVNKETEKLVASRSSAQTRTGVIESSNKRFKLSNEDMKPVRGTGLIGMALQVPGMVGKAIELRKAMKAKGKKPTLDEGMRLLLDLPQKGTEGKKVY